MKLLGDDVLPRQGLNPRCRESFDERREVGPCRGLRLPSAESHIDLRARLRPSDVGRQNAAHAVDAAQIADLAARKDHAITTVDPHAEAADSHDSKTEDSRWVKRWGTKVIY